LYLEKKGESRYYQLKGSAKKNAVTVSWGTIGSLRPKGSKTYAFFDAVGQATKKLAKDYVVVEFTAEAKECRSLQELQDVAKSGKPWFVRLVCPNRMEWYELWGCANGDPVKRYSGKFEEDGHEERVYNYQGALMKIGERLKKGFQFVALREGEKPQQAPEVIDPTDFIHTVELVEGVWNGFDKEKRVLCQLPLTTVMDLCEQHGITFDSQQESIQLR
jgi:hypothetical protein